MSRIPKSTFEDIALACEKLAQDGRLTLGNLRMELGGGGQQYLAAHYRTWLQKRRQACRVPFESLVSEGLKAALNDEFEAIRSRTKKEMLEEYQEDKEQIQAFEDENSQLHEKVKQQSIQVENLDQLCKQLQTQLEQQQIQYQEERQTWLGQKSELQARITTHESEMRSARFENLKLKEESEDKKTVFLQQEENLQKIRGQFAEQAKNKRDLEMELVILKERSLQQNEILNYVKADLHTKKNDNEILINENKELYQKLNILESKVASAQSSLDMAKMKDQAWIDLLKPVNKVQKWSIKPVKSQNKSDRNNPSD